MIQTFGLTKKFGDFLAVDQLDLSIVPGEVYGFLGPNGAGKTTTLKIVLGLLQPTSGYVNLFGERMEQDPFRIRRRLGVVLEAQNFYDEMSAWEYLLFFGRLYEVNNPEKRAKALLERLSLWRFRNIWLGGFSTGMLRKIAFARALLHDPELLILDEPVSGLDPFGIVQIREILKEEQEAGKTILISSHILSEIEKTADRVGIIARGKLITQSSMQEIRKTVQETQKIELDVVDPHDGLVDSIKGLSFVLSVKKQKNLFLVDLLNDVDHRADFAKALFEMGVLIQGMKVIESSLEELFITITESYVNQLTDSVKKISIQNPGVHD